MQLALLDTTPSQITPPLPLSVKYESLYINGVTEFDIHCCLADSWVSSKFKEHAWYLDQNEFWFWSRIIDSGKSYMVGDIPTSQYLRRYSSPLSDWQQLAYKWALANPEKILLVETKTHHWRVYLRGEYVEFALPHQEKGGERNYVTRDGKTKVLVNVD